MGGVFSSMLCCKQRPDQNTQSQPIETLLMSKKWKSNDLLYEYVKSKRQKFQNRDIESLLRMAAKFSTCKVQNCKCKGGIFPRLKLNHSRYENSICIRSNCKHEQSEHIKHLRDASTKDMMVLMKSIFDILNLKLTLKKLSVKNKTKRNILLKGIFQSVYNVLIKSVLYDPFTTPNIDTIYGSPPFEKTNIEQVLLNFCMYIFGDNKKLKLENALMLNKFVLVYFDTWMWSIPKELLECNSKKYSKSYNYYYCRFLIYCCLPRCVHSISLRYRPTKIFGQDVLKYTLKAFRIQLQVWCYKNNIMWKEQTKLFCLTYLPIYMDLLEKEVFNNKSPIWDMDYELQDLNRKTNFLEC
ncbi:hypothetical protein QTP88_025428 [Uroleucon formosanum]